MLWWMKRWDDGCSDEQSDGVMMDVVMVRERG